MFIFKSFIIYRQLWLWCCCKSETHGKDPNKNSWYRLCCQMQQVLNLECIFHNWRRLNLTSVPRQILETLQITLTKKRNSWRWSRLLPPKTLDENLMLYLKQNIFLFSFFPLLWHWPGKVTVSFLSGHCNWEQYFECWIFHQKLQSVHDAKDPLVLPMTNFFAYFQSYHKLESLTDFYSQNIQFLVFTFLWL